MFVFYNFSQEELRSYCRSSIESLEMWARRLIHEELTDTYGKDYITHQMADGSYIIKADIRKRVAEMKASKAKEFVRDIDTLFFEDLTWFFCNEYLYREHFRKSLQVAYPQGKEMLKTFFDRIIPIRNSLSHSNPISIHEAEQAICYSHDFIEGLKSYYKEKGVERVWNVPRIIHISDSFGNDFDNPIDSSRTHSNYCIPQEIHCGDTYTVYITIDPTFSADDYTIHWKTSTIGDTITENSSQLTLTFSERNVSANFWLWCELVSKKSWHKFQSYDCKIGLQFSILPPVL